MSRRGLRRIGALATLVLAAATADAAGDVEPGAYCPFPKPGEKPRCLEPARSEYGEFFAAFDAGAIDDETLSRVETDLTETAEKRYLALSSLSYGYYRLAQQVAADPEESDPAVVARLERWNRLLAAAYEANPDDTDFQAAVHEAASDLHQRGPRVELDCLDERGEPARCHSTEALLRTLSRRRDESGVRGAVGRLLERVMGEDGS